MRREKTLLQVCIYPPNELVCLFLILFACLVGCLPPSPLSCLVDADASGHSLRIGTGLVSWWACLGVAFFDGLLTSSDSYVLALSSGQALDGYGIYGPNVATTDGTGKAATDLDACGGRYGVFTLFWPCITLILAPPTVSL